MTNSKNINTIRNGETAPEPIEDEDYERILGRAVMNEVLSAIEAYELINSDKH